MSAEGKDDPSGHRPVASSRGAGSELARRDSPGADTGRGWPALDFEEHPWKASWRTYQAAVVPPIAGLKIEDHLDTLTAADVGHAHSAIIEFDQRMSEQFGRLELGTISTVLMRSEASSSSQIERLTVSAKQLALSEIGESKRPNARLVRGNVTAMAHALAHDGFDTDQAVEMQHDVLADTGLALGVRTEQVWIGTSGSSPVGADFVAPHHSRVAANLHDLWHYMNENSPIPLAQVAIAHAQFETIHPFVDGNGRVGRALVHRHLRHAGLTSHVTVPISAGLLAEPEAYVKGLTSYRAGDPVPIVSAFAKASLNAASVGRELVDGLKEIRDEWGSRIRARRDSVAWRIADSLIGQPAITADLASRQHGVSAVAARTAIHALVEAGVLTKASTGTRNQVWVAEQVTACFDHMAVLIGRRSY